MKKKDLILITVLLVLALGALLVMKYTSNGGNVAVVSVNTEEYARLRLKKDTTLLIETEEGNNLIAVENGEVYMLQADCRDKICEKEGRISEVGEVIVCLPHKIIITIETDE